MILRVVVALVLLVLVGAYLLAHLDLGSDDLGIVLDVVDHVVGEPGHARACHGHSWRRAVAAGDRVGVRGRRCEDSS